MVRYIFSCLLSLFCLSYTVLAGHEESPIEAVDVHSAHVGGFIGFGGLWQQGDFGVDCNCNRFTNGAGSIFSIGVLYENSTENSLLWGAQLGFEHRSIDARYVLTEDTTLRSLDSKTNFSNVPISFRHSSNVSLSALFLKPYVKWFPIRPRIFLRLGLSASLMISSNKDFHKTLLTNSVVLPNEDVVSVILDRAAIEASGLKMVSDNEVIIQDGPIKDLASLQLSVVPAIGVELRVSKHMLIVPVFEYSLPIGAVSTLDTTFKTSGLQFIVELHYEL